MSEFFVFWIFSGVAAYGTSLAYFQNTFPSLARDDRFLDLSFAFFISLLGPIGLLVSFIGSRGFRAGFMWWPK